MCLCALLSAGWISVCLGMLSWENSAYGKAGGAEQLCRRWDCPSFLSPLNAGSANSVSPTCSLLRRLAGETETRCSCRSLEVDGRGEGGDRAVCGHKIGVSDAVTASLVSLQILFEHHIDNHTTMYVLYVVIYTYSLFIDAPSTCVHTHTHDTLTSNFQQGL